MAEAPTTLVQRFWDEVWNNRNPAAAEELLAEDFVWETPTLGTHRGRAQALRVLAEMRAAFPDMEAVVETLIAEGDLVASVWRVTATQRGPYRGAAPSGQPVSWAGMACHRVADGRIVEHRASFDTRAQGTPAEIAAR